jgi:hypothetical protein
MTKRLDIQEVIERVHDIRLLADDKDNTIAHAEEDDLYADVLREIRRRLPVGDPIRDMCVVALETRKLYFKRDCGR